MQAAGLPLPLRQRDLGGGEWIGRVDFLYPEKRLVVEIDSALHHSTLSDEAADADRDRALHQPGTGSSASASSWSGTGRGRW